MNKDDLLKLLSKLFMGKEMAEHYEAANDAKNFQDAYALIYKDCPNLAEWHKLLYGKPFEWFFTEDAKAMYNTADSVAKRCEFVIQWFNSFSNLNIEFIDYDIATIYALIVGKLNLKYSEFISKDSLFGSYIHNHINKFKDSLSKHTFDTYLKSLELVSECGEQPSLVTKVPFSFFSEFDVEPLSKNLIQALHIFDGTSIKTSDIVLQPSSGTMPNPDVFHYKNKDCEYLSALIIGFYYKHIPDFSKHLERTDDTILSWNGKSEPEHTLNEVSNNDIDSSILRCYLSDDSFEKYANNINKAQRYIFKRERQRVSNHFYSHHKLKLENFPLFSLVETLNAKNFNWAFATNNLMYDRDGIERIRIGHKALIPLAIWAVCDILALFFTFSDSIPLQLLGGGLIVAGIAGTWLKYSDVKIAKGYYNFISKSKTQAKQFAETINQNNIEIINDENAYITSLKEYSEKYKKAYDIYKQRQELADKMYSENPQHFYCFDFDIADNDVDSFMNKNKEDINKVNELENKMFKAKIQEVENHAINYRNKCRARDERRTRSNAEFYERLAKENAQRDAKRAEDDAKRAGLLQCRHCSRRDKCSFWVKSNNKGNCASYRP